MPLTTEEQAARLRELASDDMIVAMQRLEDATWRWLFWPFSRERLTAIFDALQHVMHVQSNRLMGTVGSIARLYEDQILAVAQRVTELEQRMDAIERERRP